MSLGEVKRARSSQHSDSSSYEYSPSDSSCSRSTRHISSSRSSRTSRKRHSSTSSNDSSSGHSLDGFLYFCVYCQDESGDDISCDGSIEEIYEHWLAEHSNVSSTKWFRFYVGKTMKCNFCSETGTFHALKAHAKEHPETEIPVVVDKFIHTKCGLCSFVGSEMIEHFQKSHRSELECNVFNPARMSADLIRALRSIDIHEKRKCGHCAKVFEHDAELKSHHDDKHFPLELHSKKFYDGISAYAVCDECKLNIERTDFFSHLRKHDIDVKCSMCPLEFRNLLEIVTHDKQVHGMNSFNFHSSKFIDRLRKCHQSSKIVFGNGFVLNNLNLVGTKYDENTDFADYIEECMQWKKEQYESISGNA